MNTIKDECMNKSKKMSESKHRQTKHENDRIRLTARILEKNKSENRTVRGPRRTNKKNP